jgi:hypothetical protein
MRVLLPIFLLSLALGLTVQVNGQGGPVAAPSPAPSPQPCTIADDCTGPLPLTPCHLCSDGTEACPHWECNSGICQINFGACPPACNDRDCAAMLCGAVCQKCPDGVTCAQPGCLNGTCNCFAICPAPTPKTCGGIAGIQCPSGQICVDNPNDSCDPNNGGADCSGECIVKQFCGGIAGIQCPSGMNCVDDPTDSCDPNNGGADCGGMCVSAPAPPACTTNGDCICPALCKLCADGVTCATSQCVKGQCKCNSFCPPSACTAATDCTGPLPKIACRLCSDGSSACPHWECDNGTCQINLGSCPPQPQACGGIAGIQCPSGMICVDNPTDSCDPTKGGADCPGECVVKQFCGGIAAIQCPGGWNCIDDPTDSCDPNNGGADCGGICVPAPPPPQCTTAADCTGPLPLACLLCSDGSSVCPTWDCVNGACQVNSGSCPTPPPPPQTCTAATDCSGPLPLIACRLCSDGSAACPHWECNNGVCQISLGSCPPPPNTCKVATDCTGPLPLTPCHLCSDGSAACPHWDCLNGQCQIDLGTCPTPPPSRVPPGQQDRCNPHCQQGFVCERDPNNGGPLCMQRCHTEIDCTGRLPKIACRLGGCPDGTDFCPHWRCDNHRCNATFCD